MKLKIKKYRIKMGLTVEQLGILSGYSKSYISALENNEKNPTLETIKKIARALETCPKNLIYGCKDIENCNNCSFNKPSK